MHLDWFKIQFGKLLRFGRVRNISNFPPRTLILYATSVVIFLLLYCTRENPISNILSVFPGFYVFILTPGFVFSGIYQSKGPVAFAFTIITGLLFNVVLIHILFYIRLVAIFTIPLISWLLFFNVALVIIVSILTWLRKINLRNGPWISQPVEKNLVFLLILALTVRIILASIATDSIAADASLYSDYARSIIEGEFRSNVINDPTVYEAANGVQYSVHQGFIYLAAISFILFSPLLSGPVVILIILGLCLILFCYEITLRFFGNKSALWVAAVVSVHPIFVFHSVVAFGPELSSLVFLMGSMSILVQGNEEHPARWLLMGMMIGIADIIWTPNFLLFSAIFPILVYMIKNMKTSMKVILSIDIIAIAIVRLFYWTLLTIFIFFLVIFTSLSFILQKQGINIWASLSFTWGAFGVIAFWRGHINFVPIVNGLPIIQSKGTLILLQISSIPLNIFKMEISSTIIIGTLSFFLAHSTPFIIVLSVIALLRGYNKRAVRGFWAISIVGLIGTTIVFNALSYAKDVLIPLYFYSNSRFFISLVLFILMASGGVFQKIPDSWNIKRKYGNIHQKFFSGRKKIKYAIGLILVVNLLPNYAPIPPSLELANFESRFGWVNLGPIVRGTTDENAIFIADRCTEFSWLTARKTIRPGIPISLPLFGALSSLETRALEFDARYFVLDGYTVVYYKTFDTILQFPLDVGGAIPIAPQEINYTLDRVETSSLVLEYQTPSNQNGDYTRLYYFTEANFSRVCMIDLLDNEWGVENGGFLKNENERPQIVIGNQGNYTFTWHNGNYNLNLSTTSGFIAMEFQEDSAHVSRVEFYDTEGKFMGYGSDMKKGRYFFFTGNSVIGDIRIVVTGPPGGFITVNELSLWKHSL